MGTGRQAGWTEEVVGRNDMVKGEGYTNTWVVRCRGNDFESVMLVTSERDAGFEHEKEVSAADGKPRQRV